MEISSTYDKVMNACHRLNAEAYEHQTLTARKALRQFTPCAKAEALMVHIRTGKHFGTCHMVASVTACPCHQGLTEQQLMDYEHDSTHRRAHETSDHRTLYPRLYKA